MVANPPGAILNPLSFNSLATQITKGATVTSIAVGTALAGNEFAAGDKVKLVNPITGQVQTFTVASAPSAGATSISVNSATANFDIPVNAGMFVQLTPQAGGGGVADGDKGDITVSSAGTVWTIDNNVISNAKIRQSAAFSVIGRAGSTTGDVADLTAGTDGHVLRRSGSTLGFGEIATAGIANNAVTNAKFRQSAGLSLVGRLQSSTGNVGDITAASTGYYAMACQNGSLAWHENSWLRFFRNTATEEYSTSNITFNAGAGTSPTLTAITGSGNSVYVKFTTGTSPTANSDVFTINFPISGSKSVVAISPIGPTAAAQMTNFYTTRTGSQMKLRVSTALPASTEYEINFFIWIA